MILLRFNVVGPEIVDFLDGRRGPHQDSSRAGSGPRAGRCAPLHSSSRRTGSFMQVLCLSRLVRRSVIIVSKFLMAAEVSSSVSVSWSHLSRSNRSFVMFLRLSCWASKRQIVVCEKTLPYIVPSARPTSLCVKPSWIRTFLNCLAKSSNSSRCSTVQRLQWFNPSPRTPLFPPLDSPTTILRRRSVASLSVLSTAPLNHLCSRPKKLRSLPASLRHQWRSLSLLFLSVLPFIWFLNRRLEEIRNSRLTFDAFQWPTESTRLSLPCSQSINTRILDSFKRICSQVQCLTE